MSGSIKLSLRQITPELREAIREEAVAADQTMADTVLLGLGEHFGLDVSLSGRVYRTQGGYSQFLELHVPEQIHYLLWQESKRTGFTANSCCLTIMAARYGIPYQPVRRGRKAQKQQLGGLN